MSEELKEPLNSPSVNLLVMSQEIMTVRQATPKEKVEQFFRSMGVRASDNILLILKADWKETEDRFTTEKDVMGMRFRNDSERRLVRVMLDIFFEFPADINLVAIRKPPTRRFELRVKDKDTAGISAKLLRDIAIKLENADFSIYWMEPKADALNIKIEDLDHALRVFT